MEEYILGHDYSDYDDYEEPFGSPASSNYSDDEDDKDNNIEIESTTFFSPEEHRKNIIKLLNNKLGFQFTINYELFPDLVPYFWASLNQYCQELIELFIISDGWRLDDFLKAAESHKLHSVFRCAYTNKGTIEQKAKHFRIVFQILLDAAKFQWLTPWKARNTFGLSTCMKRQIGGLFLSYYILAKQPEPPQGILSTEKRKMFVDADDSRAIRYFLNDVDKLEDGGNGKELKKEVKLAFLKLHHQAWFEKTMLRDNYCLEAPVLFLTGSKTDPRLNYFGLLKDVRDKILYLTYQGIGNTTFREMLKVAQTIIDNKKNKKKKSRRLSKDNIAAALESPKAPKPMTFQTKLRQRLDQEFRMFQQQNPSIFLEMESESCAVISNSNTKSPFNSNSSSPSKSHTSPKKTRTSVTSSNDAKAFPPERKTSWTIEDVKLLNTERDLAVIAFRIVEILRFATPANPMTTSRLVNEMRVDQNAKDLMDKYASRGKASHDNRLSCPSRLARLSRNGRHHCFTTNQTKNWMEYIGDSKKSSSSRKSSNFLTAATMLEKLKNHEVVATEPSLVLMPLEHPDTSVIDGDEEFQFEDSNDDENYCSLKTGISMDQANQSYWGMPDLNKFWEDEQAINIADFGDDPPRLSPLTQLQDPLRDTPPDSVNTSIISDPLDDSNSETDTILCSSSSSSPLKPKSWFILATDDFMGSPTHDNEDITPGYLSMPMLSNLSLCTSNSDQSHDSQATIIPLRSGNNRKRSGYGKISLERSTTRRSSRRSSSRQ